MVMPTQRPDGTWVDCCGNPIPIPGPGEPFTFEPIDPGKPIDPVFGPSKADPGVFDLGNMVAAFFDMYQEAAHEFAAYTKKSDEEREPFFYPVLGLADEAGEVAGKFKKLWRDQRISSWEEVPAEMKPALAKELGDALWYIAEIATRLGVRLSDVSKANLEKLKGRQERGTIHGSGDDR